MEDEALREATGSEPLSRQEEYAMQQEWQEDPLKLCFILLWIESETSSCAREGGCTALCSHYMVGDVNLFFEDASRGVAEVSVMVAETPARRRGIAR